MPNGIAIMNWNDRSGAEILASYPKAFDADPSLYLQIFSQHEYAGEAGFVVLMSETVNLASYFTGYTHQIYIVLFLTEQEDGNLYEDGLADIARIVLMNLESENIHEILEKQYHRLEIFPRINDEQLLVLPYLNDIKRTVIQRLREESMLAKSELGIWIKDEFKEGEIDIDTVINGLLRSGLIKMGSVKGYSSDLLFMIKDFMVSRKPPKFYKDPSEYNCPNSLADTYRIAVRTFFSDYRPSETDNFELIDKVILNPVNYAVLTLLRLAIVTRSDLEKLRRRGVDDIDSAINFFKSLNMITILHDAKKIEYFALISDFDVSPFFPRYQLNLIRKNYMVKRHSNPALTAHIDYLDEEYSAIMKAKKKKKIDELPASYTARDSPMNFIGEKKLL